MGKEKKNEKSPIKPYSKATSRVERPHSISSDLESGEVRSSSEQNQRQPTQPKTNTRRLSPPRNEPTPTTREKLWRTGLEELENNLTRTVLNLPLHHRPEEMSRIRESLNYTAGRSARVARKSAPSGNASMVVPRSTTVARKSAINGEPRPTMFARKSAPMQLRIENEEALRIANLTYSDFQAFLASRMPGDGDNESQSPPNFYSMAHDELQQMTADNPSLNRDQMLSDISTLIRFLLSILEDRGNLE